ncbi:unnamed protein product [Closterium sp. Naga37s-1]|nr:unnamed protein product [Closterium sp. Naga37s-1]
MPPHKVKDRGKGKAKANDDEPWEDPPYVKWMKEQCEKGNTRGNIKREASPRRDGAGPSSARGAHADSSEGGGDTDVSSEDLEEIASSNGSDEDSDNSNVDGGSDEEETGLEPAASEAGPSTRKRKRTAKSKRLWTEEELTALAAAKWYTRDDLKQMRGKQGNQYWKKLHAHMKKSGIKWTRNSTAMLHAWKRIEAEYRETLRHNGTSGNKPKKKKPWFEYFYLIKKLPANVKPHVVDGGGAGETHADPGAPIPNDADMGEAGMVTPRTRPRDRHTRQSGGVEATPSPIPPKRSRVNETATMAAAKVIADTITTCNGQALRQLSDTVGLLITAIHMASALWRPPLAQAQNVPPPPQGPTHAITDTPGNDALPAFVPLVTVEAPRAVPPEDHVVQDDDAGGACTHARQLALMTPIEETPPTLQGADGPFYHHAGGGVDVVIGLLPAFRWASAGGVHGRQAVGTKRVRSITDNLSTQSSLAGLLPGAAVLLALALIAAVVWSGGWCVSAVVWSGGWCVSAVVCVSGGVEWWVVCVSGGVEWWVVCVSGGVEWWVVCVSGGVEWWVVCVSGGVEWFPSSEKKLRKGASVASVLCDVPEQQQEEEETPPEVIRATCKTVPAKYYPSVQVPYCACPQGSGITETKCVAGESPLSPHSPYCGCPQGSGITETKCVAGESPLSPHSPYCACPQGSGITETKCVAGESPLSPHSPYCAWPQGSGITETKCVAGESPLSPHSPYCACPQGSGITETKCVAGSGITETKCVAGESPLSPHPPYCACPQGSGITETKCVAGESPLSPHSPYCACPQGSGITETKCVAGESPLSPHSPYCACPQGSGITETKCVAGESPLSPHSPYCACPQGSGITETKCVAGESPLSPHSPYCACPQGSGITETKCVAGESPLSPHSPYCACPQGSGITETKCVAVAGEMVDMYSLALLSPSSPLPVHSALHSPHSPHSLPHISRSASAEWLVLFCHRNVAMLVWMYEGGGSKASSISHTLLSLPLWKRTQVRCH